MAHIHQQIAAGTGAASPDLSHGLNLHLQLANPLLMPVLLNELKAMRPKTHAALETLHFVHFARFLPLRDHSALLVVTEFDGPLEAYVLDFVIAIGDVFDAILKYVKDAPPLPVREHPAEFLAFVRKYNAVFMAPGVEYPGDYPMYSAYAQRSVIDIVGPRKPEELAPDVPDAAASFIDLADVQGNIVRGFRAERGCHYALRVDDPVRARGFLGELAKDDGVHAFPRLTSAREWEGGTKPPYMLNLGVTSEGLRALGVPKALRDRLPAAFRQGPADPERAERNGDTGTEAPSQWVLGRPGDPVHLLLSLYSPKKADADDRASAAAFVDRCQQLEAAWAAHGLAQVGVWRTHALSERKEHFGYREGISQPRIAGAPVRRGLAPDHQPLARAGDFLLGAAYESVYGGTSLGTLPAALCQNATFAAVRVLQQHVDRFEQFLAEAVKQNPDVDPDWIAARLMGRRMTGEPLPKCPVPGASAKARGGGNPDDNDFDYATTSRNPHAVHDEAGLVCPVGAHIRRMNPRSALVSGAAYSHRLIRRGMPYGDDQGGERGLFGIFVCADLERQFEFLQQVWSRGAEGQAEGTADPFLAPRGPDGTSPFTIPRKGNAIKLQVPKLVSTRGSLYVLMPGLGGLRWLAEGRDFERPDAYETGPLVEREITANGTACKFHPRTFDPKDPQFLADPYPFYAAFREQAPVALVRHGSYESYWVFTHALVTQVCEDTALFLKRPASEKEPRGLFFMDPPRHGEVRTTLEPLFREAIAPVGKYAREQADAAIAEIRAGLAAPGSDGSFDLVSAFSRRATRNVFMQMFGIPPADWAKLGSWIDAILGAHDEMLPARLRAAGAEPSAALLMYFIGRSAQCPAHASYSELFYRMTEAVRKGQLTPQELVSTAIHFALGGYLSTDFLVASAVERLVSAGLVDAFRDAERPVQLAMLEEVGRLDAPFQMADRFAARDTGLGGCHIPAGARVTVVYGSSNRDPKVFGEGADRFDWERAAREQRQTFGHGIHYCIGAPMAREVAPVVVDQLLRQLGRLEVVPGPGADPKTAPMLRYQDPYFRGFARLTLRSAQD